jgi:hypothetical protein
VTLAWLAAALLGVGAAGLARRAMSRPARSLIPVRVDQAPSSPRSLPR